MVRSKLQRSRDALRHPRHVSGRSRAMATLRTADQRRPGTSPLHSSIACPCHLPVALIHTMPPRAQKRKVSTPKAAETRRAPATATPAQIPAAPTPRGQPLQKETKSAAYILLAFPMLGTIAACSLATWAYKRALDPLYGSIPTEMHLNKAVWAGKC